MINRRQPTWMKFIWLPLILAAMAYGILAARVPTTPKSRVSTGPFKLVISDLQVKPLIKQEEAGQVDYNTTVTVTLDHQGATPIWWGSAASSESLHYDYGQDPHLLNERGQRLNLYFKPHGQYFSPFTRTEWYYNTSQQNYIVIYRIYTGYVPADVKRITFRTHIALQGHRIPIAVKVRDKS